TGFLLGLAARDIDGALARPVDDAGDDLELPGAESGEMRREAELLDEHQRVALRIIEQHADGVAALEDLARELAAPGAGIEAVAQTVAVDPEEALIGSLAVDDLDRGVAHNGAAVMRPCSAWPECMRKAAGGTTRPVGRVGLTCRCAGPAPEFAARCRRWSSR